MNSALKGKLFLAFLLVFAAGAATGAFLGIHHLSHHIILGPPHSGDVPDKIREHFRRALSLTAEQESKIAPIIDATSAKLETIRVETAERVRTVMEESKKEVVPLLTPEQQKKLEKLETIRVETAEKVRTVMEESKKEVAPLLTPEQQKKLEKLESEHRKMMLHHGFEQPPPPKDKPPSPAP